MGPGVAGVGLRAATVVLLAAAGGSAAVVARADIRIEGPTAARLIEQIAPGGTPGAEFPPAVYGDGRRFVTFRRPAQPKFVVLDADTMRTRSLPAGCLPVSAAPSVFLLRCDERPELFFARTGARRPLHVTRPREVVYDVGRRWLLGALPDTSCDGIQDKCVPEEDALFFVEWRTGRRIECPAGGRYRRWRCDQSFYGWNLDGARPRPGTPALGREHGAVLRETQGKLVLDEGRRRVVLGEPVACGESLLDRWVTWVPNCYYRTPLRMYAYSLDRRERVHWTVYGEQRAPELNDVPVEFARTRDFLFAAILSSVRYHGRDAYANTYALFAVPLPRATPPPARRPAAAGRAG